MAPGQDWKIFLATGHCRTFLILQVPARKMICPFDLLNDKLSLMKQRSFP